MEKKQLMKTIVTDGITYIKPVPGATADWYYGLDYEQGDLYEAEEIYKSGTHLKGRKLCLIHYPDGTVYVPVPQAKDQYCDIPVFLDNGIFALNVDFGKGQIRIIRFDCTTYTSEIHAEIPLASVKDCYNLRLHISPLTLSRQCVGENEFEIVWPEKAAFPMGDREAFFLRDKERLFFSRWNEEGEGADYKYWEETIIKDIKGNILETLPGDMMLMPNGDIWHLK